MGIKECFWHIELSRYSCLSYTLKHIHFASQANVKIFVLENKTKIIVSVFLRCINEPKLLIITYKCVLYLVVVHMIHALSHLVAIQV